MSISATLRTFRKPFWEVVLRTGEPHDAAFLRKRIRIGGAVALDGIDRFGDRFWRGEITQPPARHRVSLCQTMHHDGVVVMSFRKTGDARVCCPVINELLVNL